MNASSELTADEFRGRTPVNRDSLTPFVFRYANLWRHREPLLEYLRTRHGNRRLDSLGGSYGWPVRYRQEADYAAIGITRLGEYLDAFTQGGVKLPYLRHISVNRALPDLLPLLHQPGYFQPNWADHPWLDRIGGPELFIGQAGTSFGHLHQDQVSVHVGFVQLQGDKEFVVIPPADGRYLDIFDGREFPWQQRNSNIRYYDLEDYERFPGLRKARVRKILLRQGEAMFLPADWWHTTLNITDGVTYSVRIVNAGNAFRTLSRYLEGIPRIFTRAAGKKNGPKPSPPSPC